MTETMQYFKDILDEMSPAEIKQKYPSEKRNQFFKEALAALKEVEKINDLSGVPWKEIIKLYNAICVSMPQCRTPSDKRKKLIKTRINEGLTLDDFERLFRTAEKSDFLSGRNGKWNGCDFDWLLLPSNYARVIDGTYRNQNEQPEKKKKSYNLQANFDASWALIHAEDDDED